MTWISVKERLPHSRQRVIVFCDGNTVCEMLFIFRSGRGTTWRLGTEATGMFVEGDRITHWQPLPEAPVSQAAQIEDWYVGTVVTREAEEPMTLTGLRERMGWKCGGCGHVSNTHAASMMHDCTEERCSCVDCLDSRQEEPKHQYAEC